MFKFKCLPAMLAIALVGTAHASVIVDNTTKHDYLAKRSVDLEGKVTDTKGVYWVGQRVVANGRDCIRETQALEKMDVMTGPEARMELPRIKATSEKVDCTFIYENPEVRVISAAIMVVPYVLAISASGAAAGAAMAAALPPSLLLSNFWVGDRQVKYAGECFAQTQELVELRSIESPLGAVQVPELTSKSKKIDCV